MQPLEKTLRNKLEKTIKDARDIAEDAARASLEQLGVGEPTAYPHLTEADRKLRCKLRAHGRQLGNGRNAKGEQVLDRLIEEVAYEHWHRMLFARFLAENNLLMYPDPDDPVAVTLEECEDLAADEGAANGWELASRFAAQMLPQIFRPDSPVFQIVLPPEHQQKLEGLVNELPQQVFTASDSLGWVYQFWQAKKKDEVNASEVKIGARELPAVTQLFTEPYMVSFLLDNSLGAWWVGKRLSENDLKTAKTEEELRNKASLDGVPLEYLRFIQNEDGYWTPAAGTFDGWPESLSELKTLDPCCGSGHFLVAAFLILVPIRMELEGLSVKEAVDAVLRENIHGLELDQRCVELAAFALALTAWKYPNAGGFRPLPELNVACSGLSVSAAKDEWKQLASGKQNLRIALDWMFDTFKNAPVLGSLLNPAKTESAKIVQWEELAEALDQALKLKREKTDEEQEAAVVAHGLAKAAMLLAAQYHLVITNVPYLARGKQNEILTKHCDKFFRASKSDLATVFLDRCLEFCVKNGTASIVLTQNWLFLKSYKGFREKLLRNTRWNNVVLLGGGAEAFHLGPGNITNIAMVTITRKENTFSGDLIGGDPGWMISGIDVTERKIVVEKADALRIEQILTVNQEEQKSNPDSRIVFTEIAKYPLLEKTANALAGINTGDYSRWGRNWWELSKISSDWEYQQTTTPHTYDFSGFSNAVRWCSGTGEYEEYVRALGGRLGGSWKRGADVWGKQGIAISQMSNLPVSLYSGTAFDSNISVVVPHEQSQTKSIFAYCKSEEFASDVRTIDKKLNVTNATLAKVPFDFDKWTRFAEEKYPNGLPKPYSDNPTQWIFHGHPCGSVVWDENTKWTADGPLGSDDTVLQIAVARLLSYRWPAELDAGMELADEQREWVNRCENLLPYADDDGIVCIPPVRGEMKAEDRLENLLAAAYGSEWSSNKKAELLAQSDHAGKTLETWLRDKFFIQHCKLFHHRPFIWHIWDGLHDGFAAVVNYHKLDAKLLETLIYTYLGDWISRQKQDITNGVDGAQEKLDAAEALKKKLELILEGETPYDIFVRWKPIEKQPIGWNPDLNDGVRLNIRPFMTVGDVKKKGAGILRDKPNIKWGKDRGKDVASAPWYHLGPQYGGNEGDRINDHYLTLEEKQKARQERK